MVILTSFRLYNVSKPVASLTSFTLPWKLSLCAAWLTAVIIATIPIIMQTSHYFGRSYHLSNWYFSRRTFITRLELAKLAIRLATLSNQTSHIDDFSSIQKLFETNFSNGLVRKQSYYSETNICLPGFLPAFITVQTHGNIHWSLSRSIKHCIVGNVC